jgi:hypothetical protein
MLLHGNSTLSHWSTQCTVTVTRQRCSYCYCCNLITPTAALHNINTLYKQVSAVIAGAETGVELSDMLSARMGVLSNGEELSLARRNKYLMGEQVRKSTRAVQQKMATSWEDIELFLQEWNPNPLQVGNCRM